MAERELPLHYDKMDYASKTTTAPAIEVRSRTSPRGDTSLTWSEHRREDWRRRGNVTDIGTTFRSLLID